MCLHEYINFDAFSPPKIYMGTSVKNGRKSIGNLVTIGEEVEDNFGNTTVVYKYFIELFVIQDWVSERGEVSKRVAEGFELDEVSDYEIISRAKMLELFNIK